MLEMGKGFTFHGRQVRCVIGEHMDMTGRSRRRISAGVAVAAAALPCVLFDGVFDWEDFVFSNL